MVATVFRSRLTAEQVSLGFGLIWGLAVAVSIVFEELGWRDPFGNPIVYSVWAIAVGAVFGMLMGKLAYRKSTRVYSLSAWYLLLWAPFTLILTGALFGFIWGLVAGGLGPISGIYGAAYGATVAPPGPDLHRNAGWVLALQGSALVTHLIVRGVHRTGRRFGNSAALNGASKT